MIEAPAVPEPLVVRAVAGAVLVVVVLLAVRRTRKGKNDAQRERDRAHEAARERAPEEAAQKGGKYELVVKETQYDRTPPEVRGTIHGLQTFVREIPDPEGSDALAAGETIRVQVTDYGTEGTTAQARFLGRV